MPLTPKFSINMPVPPDSPPPGSLPPGSLPPGSPPPDPPPGVLNAKYSPDFVIK